MDHPMKIDDVRKTVSNPKPLYFAAGLGDAAVEVLKDAPAHLNSLGAKAGAAATDVAGKVAGTAESLQSKITLGQFGQLGQLGGQLTDQLGQLDAKAIKDQLDPKVIKAQFAKLPEPDLRAAREKAQTLLLQQVGWALEFAGKAVETYDEYSERGKGVVDRLVYGRGSAAEVVDVEDGHGSAERIVVERVTVVEETPVAPAAAPAAEAKAEAPKTEAPKAETPKSETPAEAPKAETAKPEAPKPAAQPTAQANGQKPEPKKPTPPRRPAPRGKKAE